MGEWVKCPLEIINITTNLEKYIKIIFLFFYGLTLFNKQFYIAIGNVCIYPAIFLFFLVGVLVDGVNSVQFLSEFVYIYKAPSTSY